MARLNTSLVEKVTKYNDFGNVNSKIKIKKLN